MSLRAAYWAILAAALGVYAAMVGWTLPAISDEAGGLMPFDLRPTGYSGDAARAFLAALSDRGRAIYLGPQRWLDLIYPALLALALLGAVRVFVGPPLLRWLLVALILIGMLADYSENARVAAMLHWDGAVPDDMVAAASLRTRLKSVFTGVVMVAVLLALARAGLRRVRRG